MSTNHQWDLTCIYGSLNDPNLETDLKEFETQCAQFFASYSQNTNYRTDANALEKILLSYEKLLDSDTGFRPLMYLYYILALDALDSQAQSMLVRITQRITEASNKLVFFTLELGKIEPTYQTQFLSNQHLTKYHYFLERKFLTAKYDLLEEQEKILRLLSQPSYSLWTQGVEKALSSRTVPHEGKDIPLSEAQNIVSKLPTRQRRHLHHQIMQKCGEVIEFAESELNAILATKRIEDELRGYKAPYQERVLSGENDEATIERMIEIVTSHFHFAHQFYRLKAKMLKLTKLRYADRNADVGNITKTFSYDEAMSILKTCFGNLDPEFSQILERMATKGQIDVYPRKGKQGGAFCSSGKSTPTLVLLNYVDTFDSVRTFAHEMGHAIHSELSKTQTVLYQDYSLSTAETASTFFQNVVFDRLMDELKTPEEKIVALHDKIADDVNTIFRQIAVFNFELELHKKAKVEGFIAKEKIGELLNAHMQSYLGPLVDLTPEDGNFFVVWPHLRNFFYVYTYAFGQLVSKALYAKVKEDKKFVEKVRQFLLAGGSDTPEHIFQAIGIDVTDPAFFKAGLDSIQQDINTLEGLLKTSEL
ncbi:M3 family oligoendopeptidase [Candidatus Woesebacteria bacterium]|nr:M3 family oligoendopeptidase [Candidatus Woesebacteria bacterium]